MALAMKQFVVAVRLDVAAARMPPASRASRKTENSKVLSSDSREPAFCRNVEFRQSTCRKAESSRKWREHSTLAILGGPERQSGARQTVPRSLRPKTQATIFSERLEENPPVLISVQQREPPAVRSALFQERSRALHRACAHR